MTALRTFEHDGLVFDVDDSGGAGDLVVLLHGYPQTRRCWDRVTPLLVAAGYRVVAPDQRGYSPGARPRGRRNYALDRLVADLMALADAAAADRFHVVGHDWGAAVAWAAAGWHPERLTTMTTLATPHFRALLWSMVSSGQLLRSWYMLFCQLPWLPEAAVTGDRAGAVFARALVRSGLSEERAQEYVRFLQDGAAGPAVNWYRAMPFNSPARLAAVTVPVLHLHGSADFALTRRAADLTGRYVEGEYRYEVLDGVSHWIPEEAADVAVPLVLEHLWTHPGNSSAAGDPTARRRP